MINYSTEYLILHEDEVDWKKLSADASDYFSLIEARLFRKHINWKEYIETHSNILSEPFLEVASKYFTDAEYFELTVYGVCNYENFVIKHAKEFAKFAVMFFATTQASEKACIAVANEIDDKQFQNTGYTELLMHSLNMNNFINDKKDEYSDVILYLKSHL